MSETVLRAEAAVLVSKANPHANFLGLDRLTVVNARGTECGRCDALIQFAGLPPDRRGIERAQIRLLLCETGARAAVLRVCPNAGAFDKRTVSWATRPEVVREACSDILVDGAQAGEYIDVDVTSLLPEAGDAFFGIALSARPVPDNCAVFFAGDPAPAFLILAERKPNRGTDIESVYRESAHELSGSGIVRSPAICLENAYRATVFCKNTGESAMRFSLQISPDGADFLDDAQSIELAPGETGALTPYLFSRYLRASATSLCAEEVRARIAFQIQTRDYRTS